MIVLKRDLKADNDVTGCASCSEILDEPYFLPCLHVFCLNCLWEEQSGKPEFNCPLCKAPFGVEGGDCAKLTNKLFVGKSVAGKGSASKKFSDFKCGDICLLNSEGVSAKCLKSLKYLCDDMQRYLDMSDCQTHAIGSTDESAMSKKCSQLSVGVCDELQNKELEIYCTECKSVTCKMSYTEKSCVDFDVDEFVKSFKLRMTGDFEEIRKLKQFIRTRICSARLISEEFARAMNSRETDVRKQSEKIKSLVDEHRDFLLKELQAFKDRQVEDYDKLEEELQTTLTMLESFEEYSSEVIDQASPSDSGRIDSDLRRTVAKLKDQMVADIGKFASVRLFPRDLSEFNAGNPNWNLVGTLSFFPSSVRSVPFGTINYDNTPTLLNRMTFQDPVRALTVLENKLFIMFRYSPDIHVYDSDTFRFEKLLKVTGMMETWDIVSIQGSLFISCKDGDPSENGEVYSRGSQNHLITHKSNNYNGIIARIQLSNLEISCWLVDDENNDSSVEDTLGDWCGRSKDGGLRKDMVNQLSVNNQRNLIVCSTLKNKIKEFTPNGILLRTISIHRLKVGKLDVNAHTGFSRAFQISRNEFLLHNCSDDYICLVNTDGGQVSTVYPGISLVFVDRNGFILAKDSQIGTVSLLNSALNVLQETLPELSRFSKNASVMYLDEMGVRLYLYNNINARFNGSLSILRF